MSERKNEDENSISSDDNDEDHALFLSALESSAAWATVKKPMTNPAMHKINSTVWTGEMDNILREAVSLYEDDWTSIAAYLAGRIRSLAQEPAVPAVPPLPPLSSIPVYPGPTIPAIGSSSAVVPIEREQGINMNPPATGSLQPLPVPSTSAPAALPVGSYASAVSSPRPNPTECSHRWRAVLNPSTATQSPPWTQEQLNELISLVHQQQQLELQRGEGGKINWAAIAHRLGRSQSDVTREYKAVRATTLRNGQFTPEEDEIIVQRFIEWQQRYPGQQGLWVALGHELNRKDKRISERWRHVLQKRFNMIDGQIDLTNMYKIHNNSSDGGVGGGLSMWEDGAARALQELSQREQRKRNRLEMAAEHKAVHTGLLRWDAALDERLREAVSLYPRDWTRINMHVGVEANSSKCRKRWARLQLKHRKVVEGEAGLHKLGSFQFDLEGKDGEGFGELGEEDVDGLDIDDVGDEDG